MHRKQTIMMGLGGLLVFLALSFTGVSAQAEVAFSGVRTTDQNPGSQDDPVTYNHIDTNLGDAFDGTTFTVPVAGLYLFTFSATSDEVTLHLKVNGVIKRSTEFNDQYFGYTENIVSNSVILELNVGDNVGIFLSFYSRWLHIYDDVNHYISFSGVLLHESMTGVAAFSAARSIDQDDDTVDKLISYDVIDTDIGGAFDGSTFVAPNSGLYLFTFAGRGISFQIELKVNDVTLRSVHFEFFFPHYPYIDNSFSNFMMLTLNPGDRVETYLSGSTGDGDLINSDLNTTVEGIFTEFSGVLLKETLLSSLDDIGHHIEDDITAFSATRTEDMAAVSTDTPIQFDVEDCNIGRAFDGVSKFQAPVDGYYLFTFSAGRAIDVKVHLKVDGVERRSAMRRGYQYYDHVATNSAILRLNRNEEVELFLDPFEGHRLEMNSLGYTHFSGVLLFQDRCLINCPADSA